jgi:integrase
MAALKRQDSIAARALEFLILTAARTGEVVGAEWVEINDNIWVVPGRRMKSGCEHRVPLSGPAMAILGEMLAVAGNASVVFTGRNGQPLALTTMLKMLRRIGYADITVHGFRSTFRDWCAEATNYPREVAEAALAHANPNRTEAAYRRGDLFERRRTLMEDWAELCSTL